jgi:SAM-dependent methyltransferase
MTGARIECALCGARPARELFHAQDRLGLTDQLFTISECEGCGVRLTRPEMSDAELASFYPDDYWGADPSEKWIRSSQREKTKFLLKCRTGGRVLDVGCGAGFFLRALDAARWERYGVEVGPGAAEAASRFLGRDRVRRCPLLEAEFEAASFDVVTLWSSLEHMRDPRANLLETKRILKPGGVLIVQVPNAGSYQARWFRGRWFALDVPRHRYHFDTETLRSLLESTGFRINRATLFSAAHNAHALRQSLKAIMREGSRLKFGLFYLAVPFLKPLDRIMTLIDQGATMTIAAESE